MPIDWTASPIDLPSEVNSSARRSFSTISSALNFAWATSGSTRSFAIAVRRSPVLARCRARRRGTALPCAESSSSGFRERESHEAGRALCGFDLHQDGLLGGRNPGLDVRGLRRGLAPDLYDHVALREAHAGPIVRPRRGVFDLHFDRDDGQFDVLD